MKNKIVDVRALTKKYNKSGTLALDNIDLSSQRFNQIIRSKWCAGKSTFINIIGIWTS